MRPRSSPLCSGNSWQREALGSSESLRAELGVFSAAVVDLLARRVHCKQQLTALPLPLPQPHGNSIFYSENLFPFITVKRNTWGGMGAEALQVSEEGRVSVAAE